MTHKVTSVHRRGPFSPELVAEAAHALRTSLGAPAQVAFAFVTPEYVPHLEEFCEIIRVDGHVMDIVGSTGQGVIAEGVEEEEGEGFGLLALAPVDTKVDIRVLSQETIEDDFEPWTQKPESAILLANPFLFDLESWLAAWNEDPSQVPCVGGLASGDVDGDATAVFYNGRSVDGIIVGFAGDLRVMPVVSQGCRPIGEPLTVTRAEKNVVYSLGSHPAYEALESAFQGLSDGEKAVAKGNLLAGLAGTEYVEEFKSGDFLVRNIIGADPDSGAVVIAGIPRVGQTLQYQLRDHASAHDQLRDTLRRAGLESGKPLGSLLFSCSGRGTRFFGSQNHDAALAQKILGAHSSAGFFCNAEIAPVGERNYIHSYTVSCALFTGGNTTQA